MKRIFLAILALYSITAVAQTLTDGRLMCHDRITDTYLCSVPEAAFDDGSVAEYTAQHPEVRFTFLPIVVLSGDFGYDYTPGTVKVVMPDGTGNVALTAKLKWRGGSTNTDGKHKRNYHIKFVGADGLKEDHKFFGLRKDNSWLLDAAQVDFSRIRNRVATDLWNDFATKPYYFASEPKALTGTRGQFVEVFLDNEYRGIYCMTENIDRSQMKLKKYTDNADGTQTIHGQLWKGKDGSIITGFWGVADYDNTQETWRGFETKYPDIEDVNPTDYKILHDAVRYVAETPDDKLHEHIDEYFDMPVLRDYYIMNYVLGGIDTSAGKNKFWACYDRETDKKLTIAVWDMDVTVGQNWDPNNPDDPGILPTNVNEDSFWGLKMVYYCDSMNINGFHDKVLERYAELRKTFFSEEQLTSRYTTYMDMLTKAGAYRRETKRWSGDSDLAYRDLDFAAERQKICEWLHTRLATIDDYGFPDYWRYEQMLGIRDVPLTPHSASATIYDLGGRAMTGASLPKGMYIRGGKKYVVR